MRTITDHKLNGLNEALIIDVMDEPGQGGACHFYSIYADDNAPEELQCKPGITVHQTIYFQNGPIKEFGVNGISGEALLAINIDRLRCFQAGPYASDDNAQALHHLEQALFFLQKRTRERLARGVEGTSQK